ncbi:PREDICTED: ATR-interacting protein isoform X2 [Gekko japonicus]|uniref:ATR-interacting protein isoform X2 n=1 Tax=Gekko japonicus TaxID=146911 RepID=A0ABM1KGA3_GEKJA|nr:PREDICTED: ATR-interacting protein isoform X2 [Gekko japonicus]
MSVNHLFGNKKRNSSILYSMDQVKVTASSSFQGATNRSNIGDHGDGFPPNKRYKTLVPNEQKEMEDPFGDSDDFTADDLEEIDLIASQALTQKFSLQTNVKSEWNAGLSSPLNNTSKPSSHMKQSNVDFTTGREVQFGRSTEETSTKDKFRLETLQAQYEEAKKKLQQMQDEILIKNGEIRILRDSMQQMESAVEEQRKSHLLLEEEKEQHLREKEKEFSKKLQSLQSELQFRDAEMNEMRTKLLNCERIKPVTSAISYTSPKKSPSSIVKIEGCTQNEKQTYPTKESFGSQLSPKASCSKTLVFTQHPWLNRDNKKPNLDTKLVKQEMSYICAQRQGSILITALMKQPIVEESLLGLCCLLSSQVEAQPGPVLQSGSCSTGCTGTFSDRSTCSEEQEGEEETSLKLAQKLALTGLNLIAMDDGSLDESCEETKRQISHLKRYKIPGAVYLLPLLEHHIGAYCQALQLMLKTGSTSSGNQSACSSRVSSSTRSSTDDFQSNQEEFALTSLGILYCLVFYSWDVVCTLLSHNMKPDHGLGGAEIVEKDKTVVLSKQCRVGLQEPNPELDAANDDGPQHPLFKSLLHLLTLCTSAAGCQRHCILNQCLKVLVKLAEKSTGDLLMSFSPLLNSQVQALLRCVSSEAPVFAVHLTVRLLTLLAEHQELAAQLCTASENCLLLALYMYITSRPDKSTPEMLWLQLEQETVRFLTKCMQCCSISLVGRGCQCNPEVVKALIIMLHRQWLTVRRVEGNLFDVRGKRVVRFLRDTVLLLHSLSQKDKLFHDHCLEVLHQYDHVMPGVRAILRKIPNLKACEELALDELYPLETETDDQEMDCS